MRSIALVEAAACALVVTGCGGSSSTQGQGQGDAGLLDEASAAGGTDERAGNDAAAEKKPEMVVAERFSFLDYEAAALPQVDFGDNDIRTYPFGRNGPLALDATQAITGRQGISYTLNSGTAYPEWDPYNYGGLRKNVTSPRGFAREFADAPAGWKFNTYNRLVFWMKASKNASAMSTTGGHNIELGTYVKSIANPDTRSDEAGGGHYYHFLNIPPTGTWTKVVLNMHPDHQRGGAGAKDWGNLLHPTGEPAYNYWDTLTRFYMEFDPYETTLPGGYPKVYAFDSFELQKVDSENDDQIYALGATYVAESKRVILNWRRRKSDPLTLKHEVRYAFDDIHKIGWGGATAAPKGTIDPTDYNGMLYDTTDVPTDGQTVLYLAIKPQASDVFSQISLPLN